MQQCDDLHSYLPLVSTVVSARKQPFKTYTSFVFIPCIFSLQTSQWFIIVTDMTMHGL